MLTPVASRLVQKWVENFRRWDHDQNGQIDPSELLAEIALEQPDPEDSASLATLYREALHESHQSLDQQLPCLDKARLKAYLAGLEQRHLDVAFAGFLAKIQGQGEPLCQGQLPSCALVSTAWALEQRQPGFLQSLVQQSPEGLNVYFHDQKAPIRVGRLSSCEKALYTTGMAEIEKAWGIHEGAQADQALRKARGNGVDRVITALTGHPAKTYLLPHPATFQHLNAALQKKRPGAPTLQPPALEPILNQMKQALESQAVVVSGTASQTHLPGLQPDHAHTVVACDDQKVRLRNPHGRGEPGCDEADDGIFEISLADYVANFNSVTLEQLPPQA